MNIRKGPIDRVYDPPSSRTSSSFFLFFAYHTVIRESFQYCLPQICFSFAICNRDKTTVRLLVSFRLPAKIFQRDIARSTCDFHRELKQIIQLIRGCLHSEPPAVRLRTSSTRI